MISVNGKKKEKVKQGKGDWECLRLVWSVCIVKLGDQDRLHREGDL